MSVTPASRSALLPSDQRWLPHLAVALAVIAGACDGMAVVGLKGVFVSNQTGNMVLLGLGFVRSGATATADHTISLVAFVIGVAVAGLLIEYLLRRGIRHPLPALLLIQGILIATAAVIITLSGNELAGSAAVMASLFALASAMGMQSVCLHRVGKWSLQTVAFNPMLVSGTLDLVAQAIRSPISTAVPDRRPPKIVIWFAVVVASFIVGAILAALMYDAGGPQMLFIVAGATLLSAFITTRIALPDSGRPPQGCEPDQP